MTDELMQTVLALPKAELQELRDAIDARLASDDEPMSPELIAMLDERSADRSPGLSMQEVLARLRQR